tara:strand:+ start:1063 stop:1251 length:189 start_codon:yes stop_codon:yes gene_type:complete
LKTVNTAQYVAPPIDASAEPTIIKVTFVGNSIEHFVPIDTNNSDYQVVQAWVANGNTIAEAD